MSVANRAPGWCGTGQGVAEMDVIMMAIAIAFFALSFLYTNVCEKL
jgi:hypothetical protein